MEFRILGPLEVFREGVPVELGALKERTVLATLLLHANEVVSRERLIDELWGESPPPTARKAVNVYMSQLRKTLTRDGDDRIATEAGGYKIEVDPERLDAARVQRIIASGRERASAGELEAAAQRFREALALWRGPTLSGLQLESGGRHEIERLDELRLTARMDRIDCDLALGRHEQVLSELQLLVSEHPLKERLRAQQMLALYRADRQAGALEAYRQARHTLVEELGIEPSPALQRLQQGILRQDPALEAPAGIVVANGDRRAAGSTRTSLPIQATSFIGRTQELAEVLDLLGRDDVRLLTLTGTGGSGKTRLAIEAAGELAANYRDGVWWVPLAALGDPRLVLETATQVLGARDGLANHIEDKSMLLLFDNFEHVVEAAGGLADLLTSCPRLELLVTSREPLHITGEQDYAVPPFVHEEGIRFFVARARAADPGFDADGAVSEICRRLDDLPLALELAAARVRALSAAQILDRLDRRLALLTGGARDLPERQRTLRATIAWSYELLTAEEQRLFARLSVFRGGCTIEAAEQICGATLDPLQALVEKNLLRHARERYWLLETIREYAAEKLDASTDSGEIRRRHAEYFLALAEEAEPEVRFAGNPKEALQRLERENDNLRAALDHFQSGGETQSALRLAGALPAYWNSLQLLPEGRRFLRRALAADERPTAARAKALTGAVLAELHGGDPSLAKLRAEQALALHQALGDAWWTARDLWYLGRVAFEVEGDLSKAQRLFEESAARCRELHDDRSLIMAIDMLARIQRSRGDLDRTRSLYEEILDLTRATRDLRWETEALLNLADCALAEGRIVEAVPMLTTSIEIARDLDHPHIAEYLWRFAWALALVEEPQIATRLLSLADMLDQEVGHSQGFVYVSWIAQVKEKTLAIIRTQLDDAAFAEAWEQGRRLTIDAAVTLALDSVDSARPAGIPRAKERPSRTMRPQG